MASYLRERNGKMWAVWAYSVPTPGPGNVGLRDNLIWERPLTPEEEEESEEKSGWEYQAWVRSLRAGEGSTEGARAVDAGHGECE